MGMGWGREGITAHKWQSQPSQQTPSCVLVFQKFGKTTINMMAKQYRTEISFADAPDQVSFPSRVPPTDPAWRGLPPQKNRVIWGCFPESFQHSTSQGVCPWTRLGGGGLPEFKRKPSPNVSSCKLPCLHSLCRHSSDPMGDI